jgi:NitT/TauT family transport system substrate-binding protein
MRRAQVLAAGVLAPLLPLSRVWSQDLASMTILAAGADDATPALYALSTGIFKRHGLNVELRNSNSGTATLAAIAGGSAQAGLSSVLPIVTAHARGAEFRIIAPAGIYSPSVPYGLMICRKDAPFKTGRDLNGKTIASSALKDLLATASLAWIDANGGDSSTVRAIELTPASILPALLDGRIDAATVVTPRLTEALDSGKVRVLGDSFATFGKRFAIAAWMSSADWAAKNVEVAARFAAAMREATAYTGTHHADTVQMLADYAHLDPKLIEHSTRSLDAEYLEPSDIQPTIAMAVKYKIIDQSFDGRTLLTAAVIRPGK